MGGVCLAVEKGEVFVRAISLWVACAAGIILACRLFNDSIVFFLFYLCVVFLNGQEILFLIAFP